MAKFKEESGAEAEQPVKASKPAGFNDWWCDTCDKVRATFQSDTHIEKNMASRYRGKLVAQTMLAANDGKIVFSQVMRYVDQLQDVPMPNDLRQKMEDSIARMKSARDQVLSSWGYVPSDWGEVHAKVLSHRGMLTALAGMGIIRAMPGAGITRKPMTEQGMRERITQSNAAARQILDTGRS